MKHILCTALVAAATLISSSAHALTYNWSFEATSGTSLGTVSGTISGLEIGDNDGTGLTIEVLSSPSGNGLLNDWTFVNTQDGGPAFTVANDLSVVFADARYQSTSDDWRLFFGGSGGYFPELFSPDTPDGGNPQTDHYAFTGATVFTLVETPTPVPLPAGLPLLVTGLGAVLAFKRRKKA